MRSSFSRVLPSVAAVVALAACASIRANDLTIGDSTPNFHPTGWVKGTPTAKFESGKVYVIEFWATWCGPCIASMPHLSDMADAFKGKATFISVNTWDRNEDGEKEAGSQKHVDRVTKFVKENDQKMRYNIALDDEKDTISTEWMRAAGRNGIPCAFIVNGDGKVAWIGHPMKMEEPLKAIVEGKWDMAAFKTQFDTEAKAAKEAATKAKAQREALQAAAKANDMEAFEKALSSINGAKAVQVQSGIQAVASTNPAFALSYLEKNVGKVEGIAPYAWCSLAASIVQNSKDQALVAKAEKISAECAEMSDAKMKCIAYAYHARLLVFAGKKSDALTYCQKATDAVKDYDPADARPNVQKFIDGIKKQAGG